MVIDKYVLDIFPDSSFLLLMLSSLSEVGSFAGGRKFWIMGLARENNCFKRVIPCIKPHSGGNDIPERSLSLPVPIRKQRFLQLNAASQQECAFLCKTKMGIHKVSAC